MVGLVDRFGLVWKVWFGMVGSVWDGKYGLVWYVWFGMVIWFGLGWL